ncbi:hypothetical protein U9M48_033851 [Paspalum notatum var. saurae]|uniref:Uncharacterized protein n=1 Tax=Paspalum notatum var. saurae TaxID=547442 RepID=A0AAQ3U8E2_PASNO
MGWGTWRLGSAGAGMPGRAVRAVARRSGSNDRDRSGRETASRSSRVSARIVDLMTAGRTRRAAAVHDRLRK